MRLVDKDALLSDIERTIEESGCVNHEGEIIDCVRYAPIIDATPVVRCKECLHYCEPVVSRDTGLCSRLDRLVETDDYCSYGGRR